MTRLTELPPQILETLSAYLDGEISEKDKAGIESRLAEDIALRQALAELGQVRQALRAWPQPRLRRSFVLKPEMVGRAPSHSKYPTLRLATALATLGFLATIGLDAFGARLAAVPMARSAEAPTTEMAAVAEVGDEEMAQKAPAPEAPAAGAAAEPEQPMESAADALEGAFEAALTATPTVAATAAPESRGEAEPVATAETGLPLPNELPPEEALRLEDSELGLAAEKAADLARPPARQAVRLAEILLGALVLVLGMLTLRARRRS